jgi:hypothetical protein
VVTSSGGIFFIKKKITIYLINGVNVVLHVRLQLFALIY